MDLWVVAAAAASGYLAKYWQNISRDGDALSQLSSGNSNFDNSESSGHSFRRSSHRRKLGEDVFSDRCNLMGRRSSDILLLDGDSATEIASTSALGGAKLEDMENYQDYNVLSLSTSSQRFLMNEENRLSGNEADTLGNFPPSPSSQEICSFHGTPRKIKSLRAKNANGQFVKPLSSLESCLMAHLYEKHFELEDYVSRSVPSPSAQTMRPLFVSNGTQIISRSNRESFSVQNGFRENKFNKEAVLQKNTNVLGVPQLPKLRPLETRKRLNILSGKRGDGRKSSSEMDNETNFRTGGGSQDKSIIFFFGISVGILSSLISNKREVEKLKELLKQTENLVQDLQEELEMKDSLTVKELTDENGESRHTWEYSFPEQKIENSSKLDAVDSYDQKTEGSSESLSKIEAELEAELERLGLNINTNSKDTISTGLVEIDQEYLEEFAEGELRADMISRRSVPRPKPNQDASDSTTHSGNQAVSPRELSLRLHEVIQSRLQARLEELEVALQNSHKKVQFTTSEYKNPWTESANYKLQFSSPKNSSDFEENKITTKLEPLIMDLSGDALDAYNEASEELMKMDDSEEEQPFSGVQERISKEFISGRTGKIEGNGDIGEADEDNDYSDEMEKQLINMIVEKTRRGSPAVLNAQRWLFSMDKDEHY